jgi:Leucine-rich repeat (LRR) protein
LEELSLDHVRLNAEMFEAIASISTLRKLNFGYCRHIETTDLAALKRLRNLREINYVSDTWNKGPLLERLSVLEDLESLELGDLFSSDDSVGLAPLAKLKRLRRFKIGKYAIDDDLVHLATLCRLDSVSLVGASVNGSGLRHLVGLPLLRELDLRDCPIKDDALDWIVQMPQLERLELSESDITDAGLLRLQRLRNLKYLSIAQTHTSEAARKDCRDAMPRTEVWIGWP